MINLLLLLSIIPADDWYRNWTASRTFMLRRTSKEVKKAMDKIRPPVNIRFIKYFKEFSPDWYCIYRIQKLELLACSMLGENKNMLIRLLGQCPELVHLKIVGNYNFGSAVAKEIIQVLSQCPKLEHLDLSGDNIEDIGIESLARVIGRFSSLKHLDLSWNNIGPDGVESLVKILVQCTTLTHLDVNNNNIGPYGLENLVKVIPQCPSLKHIELYGNRATRL
jgi:Ran GTPase-activating protein (RanGAP) involved in mRNA processing and transport